MRHVLESAGAIPVEKITKAIVVAGRERRQKTPSQANNYLKTLRQLFKWAIEGDHMTANPVDGVAMLKEADRGGFPEWTDEDEAKFIARWPLGTRQYLAIMVHACTGLRRGDAVRLGRQHFGKDGKIHIKAEKNGADLHIPIHPKLVEAVQACPPTGLAVLETSLGKPWVKESYGNTFHEWTVAAGVVEEGKPKNSHGIRKLAATRVCEAGASVHEMMALFGWADPAMAEVYTKARDTKKLAEQASAKAGVIGSLVDLFGMGGGP
jgi:integrase